MENSVKERLKLFLKENKIKATDFCNAIGVSQGYISGMRESIQPDKLNSIAINYPHLDIGWLLTGIGEMIKQISTVEIIHENNNNHYPVKPFIDSTYAVCGTPSGFSIAIKEAECEGLSLPFMKEYDFSIRAKGDSMINRSNPARSIREGDIVVCRLWTSRSHIRWGEVYALATGDGVVVKKIMPADKESFIKCVSFNEEDGYPPYELPLQEVYDWAIVTGVVSARNWN